jgi:hypothetical protein
VAVQAPSSIYVSLISVPVLAPGASITLLHHIKTNGVTFTLPATVTQFMLIAEGGLQSLVWPPPGGVLDADYQALLATATFVTDALFNVYAVDAQGFYNVPAGSVITVFTVWILLFANTHLQLDPNIVGNAVSAYYYDP